MRDNVCFLCLIAHGFWGISFTLAWGSDDDDGSDDDMKDRVDISGPDEDGVKTYDIIKTNEDVRREPAPALLVCRLISTPFFPLLLL